MTVRATITIIFCPNCLHRMGEPGYGTHARGRVCFQTGLEIRRMAEYGMVPVWQSSHNSLPKCGRLSRVKSQRFMPWVYAPRWVEGWLTRAGYKLRDADAQAIALLIDRLDSATDDERDAALVAWTITRSIHLAVEHG